MAEGGRVGLKGLKFNFKITRKMIPVPQFDRVFAFLVVGTSWFAMRYATDVLLGTSSNAKPQSVKKGFLETLGGRPCWVFGPASDAKLKSLLCLCWSTMELETEFGPCRHVFFSLHLTLSLTFEMFVNSVCLTIWRWFIFFGW